MTDPWAFGWTPLIAAIGVVITAALGFWGLRTLDKWRREKIEEKKIEVAMDALVLAYESIGVFEGIRARIVNMSEWEDMERTPGESDQERDRKGSYYAILKRIRFHQNFFTRAYAMEPKCMVLFGSAAKEAFEQLYKARRSIETACEVLTYTVKQSSDDPDTWFQCRADIWGEGLTPPKAKDPERVSRMLDGFRSGIERLCRPSLESRA